MAHEWSQPEGGKSERKEETEGAKKGGMHLKAGCPRATVQFAGPPVHPSKTGANKGVGCLCHVILACLIGTKTQGKGACPPICSSGHLLSNDEKRPEMSDTLEVPQ